MNLDRIAQALSALLLACTVFVAGWMLGTMNGMSIAITDADELRYLRDVAHECLRTQERAVYIMQKAQVTLAETWGLTLPHYVVQGDIAP